MVLGLQSNIKDHTIAHCSCLGESFDCNFFQLAGLVVTRIIGSDEENERESWGVWLYFNYPEDWAIKNGHIPDPMEELWKEELWE